MQEDCKRRYIIIPDSSLNKGDTGATGPQGAGAFLYIRYAEDNIGTGMSTIPDISRPYIGILSTTLPIIVTPASFVWQLYFGANGADGNFNYIYLAYADDDIGTGFTLSFNPTKTYVAILNSPVEISIPVVGDFTGLWTKYIGIDGNDGLDSFNYIGYAEDDIGTGFDLTPDDTRPYVAFRNSNVALVPDAIDFNGLWKKYLGVDGVDGREVEFNNTGTFLQWRYVGDVTWINLIDLVALTGSTGSPGVDGEDVFLYIGWADDDLGGGYTGIFDPSKEYIAFLQSNVEIIGITASNFTGLWSRYKGDGDRWSTTSTTVQDIVNTPFALFVEPDLAYTTGQKIVAAQAGVPSNSVEGVVQSYNGATGYIVINPISVQGLGNTVSNWQVSLQGSELVVPPSLTFDWNRPIKTLPQLGDNIFTLGSGALDIIDGLDDMFFRDLIATITLNSFPLKEVGDLFAPTLIGVITPNDSTINTRRVHRDPLGLNPSFASPGTNNINEVDPDAQPINLGISQQYRIEADVTTGGNNTTEYSPIRDLEGIYPYFYGSDPDIALSGTDAYNNLTKVLQKEGTKTVTITYSSGEYLYIFTPTSWGALTDVIDNGGSGDSIFSSFETVDIRNVTSVGLDSDYSINFNAYRTTNPQGAGSDSFQFIF